MASKDSVYVSSNNYVPYTLLEDKSTKESESRTISTLETDAQNTKQGSFIQELTFDSLLDDACITIKQSEPIRNIALFISFNYDLNNQFLQQECNSHRFHALFRDIQDHVNIAPIVKLVTDIVINCWACNWNIIVFITSEPILPINAVTALLKQLRIYFDQKILEIIIIWPNVFERSRPWVDKQCRIAKATTCIQGENVSDIIPQIMIYLDNGNYNNGTTTLLNEKKITTCYHEFNNSYPAAMEINDKIWIDVKQYFKVMKSEMEKDSLFEANSENILRKALYNKFSQHLRLKHMLFSTRVASIYYTGGICQCSLYNCLHPNFKNIVRNDPEILRAKFINILKEVRYSLMQREKKRIESEYRDLTNRDRNLFLFDLCN